jgi:hypothetical protein
LIRTFGAAVGVLITILFLATVASYLTQSAAMRHASYAESRP